MTQAKQLSTTPTNDSSLLLELRARLALSYPEDPRDDTQPRPARTLVIVDDRRIHLPCTAESTEGITIALERNVQSCHLDLSICFERDPALDDYAVYSGNTLFEVDNGDAPPRRFLQVGYIYGRIWRGEAISRASFTAATSGMSRLFEASPSIQRTFVALARTCRAELVAFDFEGGEFEILDDPPRQRVTVETESFDEQDNYFELDPAALLASIRAARAALNSTEGAQREL